MIRYSNPEVFILFIPLVGAIFWYVYKGKVLHNKMENLGSKNVKFFLLNRINTSRIHIRSYLRILSVIFIFLAASGPQIGTKLTELKRQGVDIFILMDTSKSMNATDVKPSRIEKAKSELNRLINNLKGDRIGIIAFASTAHMHCPLTEDYSAAKLFLNMINTDIIASMGTDLSSPIKLALDHINEDDKKFKVLLLISDGEDHQGDAIDLAKDAKKMGIIIHTLGIGTLSGGPIPVFDKNGNRLGFKKDKNGKVITSTLNESILNEISSSTNGRFIRVENQLNAIVPILDDLKKMEKKEIRSHIFSQYEDRYQVFLCIGLVLLLFEFIIPTRTKKEIVWTSRFMKNV